LDRHSANPALVLGLILPDLKADFNRSIKRQLLYNASHDWSLFSQTVRRGVERHIQADALFHNSAFFQEHVQYLNGLLLPGKVPSFQYRRYFLSHITLELVLDRLLLEHFPYFLVDFYQQLGAIDEKEIENLWLETGAKGELQTFLTNLEKFIYNGYLWYYRYDNMLSRAIIRTYSRLKEVVPTEREKQELKMIIETLRAKLYNNFLWVFDDMQTQMS